MSNQSRNLMAKNISKTNNHPERPLAMQKAMKGDTGVQIW